MYKPAITYIDAYCTKCVDCNAVGPARSEVQTVLDKIINYCDRLESVLIDGMDGERHIPRRERIRWALLEIGFHEFHRMFDSVINKPFTVRFVVRRGEKSGERVEDTWKANRVPPTQELFRAERLFFYPDLETGDTRDVLSWQFLQGITQLADSPRRPLGEFRLDEIERSHLKLLVASLMEKTCSRVGNETVKGPDGTETTQKKTIHFHLSKASLRIILSTLTTCLTNAQREDGLIPANPALSLGRFIKQAKPRRECIDPFVPHEVTAFLKAVQETAPDYLTMFIVLLHTRNSQR
jgi:hypothetical protein